MIRLLLTLFLISSAQAANVDYRALNTNDFTTNNMYVGGNSNQWVSASLVNPPRNTFVGMRAGNHTMTGVDNLGVGWAALGLNTSGSFNTAVGVNALQVNTSGFYNVAIGVDALVNNTTGIENFGMGYFALGRNINGDNNVAIGQVAMQMSTNGASNVAIGSQALESAFSPQEDVAIGQGALGLATNVSQCTAVGAYALEHLINQANNTAVGYASLTTNIGVGNTALGADAGRSVSNAQNCIFIGNMADGSLNLTNAISVGANAIVAANNTFVLGGTGANAVSVAIGATTAPTATFEVTGSKAAFPVALFKQGNPSYFSQVIIDSPADDIDRPSFLSYWRGGSQKWQEGLILTSTSFGIGTGYNLSDQKVIVDTSGKVAVGNTAPASALDVTGDIRASTTVTATNGYYGFATNKIVNANTAGYTNSSVALGIGGTNSMVARVVGTTGTLEFYNRSGLNGQTVCGVGMFTNTIVANTAWCIPVGVNQGFIIRSPVNVDIQCYSFP